MLGLRLFVESKKMCPWKMAEPTIHAVSERIFATTVVNVPSPKLVRNVGIIRIRGKGN